MRVGLTFDLRNPKGLPWREFWEDSLWLFCEAEELGFDSLLLQEHFFMPDGYSASVPVFLSQLATRTKKARIGSYIQILPLHHAAQLAQETAVLDHLSGGRLDVAVGAGWAEHEYAAWGYSLRQRGSRMEEGLEVLKKAWTERPFSFKGRYYDIEDLSVIPEPLQAPHPPLWVGCASPAAAARAARHRAHLAVTGGDPASYDAYAEGLRTQGLDPRDFQIARSWSITTTFEDPDSVWERNRATYFERWDYYRKLREGTGEPMINMGAGASDDYRTNELIGDPDTILETLREGRETFPITMLVVSVAPGFDLRTDSYENIRMFAEHVMPELKRW